MRRVATAEMDETLHSPKYESHAPSDMMPRPQIRMNDRVRRDERNALTVVGIDHRCAPGRSELPRAEESFYGGHPVAEFEPSGESFGNGAHPSSSASTGLPREVHFQNVPLVNFLRNAYFREETGGVTPMLPLGMPLSQPPRLATNTMPTTSYCKRKREDGESTATKCYSKVYEARTKSDPTLNVFRNMNSDERLFLEFASALSTNASASKQALLPAPVRVKGSCIGHAAVDYAPPITDKNQPLGPPPFSLPKLSTSGRRQKFRLAGPMLARPQCSLSPM